MLNNQIEAFCEVQITLVQAAHLLLHSSLNRSLLGQKILQAG